MSPTPLTLQGVANAVPAEEAMFSEIARPIVDLVMATSPNVHNVSRPADLKPTLVVE